MLRNFTALYILTVGNKHFTKRPSCMKDGTFPLASRTENGPILSLVVFCLVAVPGPSMQSKYADAVFCKSGIADEKSLYRAV